MQVDREKLIDILDKVSPGLSKKELIEQSTCFVFEDGYISTFNDDIACSHEFDEKVTGAVQADPLLKILKKLKGTTIKIELNEDNSELLFKDKRRRGGIKFEGEVLLPIATIKRPKKWRKLPKGFLKALNIAKNTASNDETRFIVTCIHIHPKFIETTDNYQLTHCKLKTGFESPILFRADYAKHIVSAGMTECGETKTWIHFRNNTGLTLSCRRYTEEEFVDTKATLKVTGNSISLPHKLKDAAERSNVFSEESENNEVSVELSRGKLKLQSTGSSGWYEEVLKKIDYDGEPITFLTTPDTLANLAGEKNKCQITEDRLRVDGDGFTYIVALTQRDQERD